MTSVALSDTVRSQSLVLPFSRGLAASRFAEASCECLAVVRRGSERPRQPRTHPAAHAIIASCDADSAPVRLHEQVIRILPFEANVVKRSVLIVERERRVRYGAGQWKDIELFFGLT